MLLPVEWVYLERTLLVIVLGGLCITLAAIGEERSAAQAVYTTGLIVLSYFIGERTGSMDLVSRSTTYLSASVWTVYVLSFMFMLYCTIVIDFSDRNDLGRPREWCTVSIAACATLYCSAKLVVLNLLIERLRIIRNEGVPRFQDRKWLFPMALGLPYIICLVFLLLDMYHKYHGRECYVGVYKRGISILIIWNAICSFTVGGMYLREFTKAREIGSRKILVPCGMSNFSIVGSSAIWICASCANLMTFLYKTAYKEHICLMNCSADLIVGILVTDYLSGLTADRAQQEDMAFAVAKKVGRMELDDLEYLFDIENPNTIQTSFRNITAILRQYRAYVPAPLLENVDDIINVPFPLETIEVVQPPSGEVTIVFTDIKASSQIWGELPEEMREALYVHNKVVRLCIEACRGYEVKTIGDSFMVAFDNPSNGLEFGVMVQLRLFEATWPSPLSLFTPTFKAAGVWNGVRVRIGIHHGFVNAEPNMTPGRVDYLGPTVNTAARLEGMADPGGIAISKTTLALAKEYTNYKATKILVIDKKEVTLRGIRTPIGVAMVFPASLSLRSEGDKPVRCVLNIHKRWERDSITVRSVSSARSSLSMVGREDLSFIKKLPLSTIGRLMVRPRPSEFGCINDTFSLVTTCLVRTDGITVGVSGNVITFSWNVARRVDNHELRALRFADMYAAYQKRGHRPYLQSVIAISSTPCFSGTIRAGGEKFMTVLGDALGLTSTQLILCEEHETFCMYSTTSRRMFDYLAPVLRQVDKVAIRKRLTRTEVYLQQSQPPEERDLPEVLEVYEVSTCGWSEGLSLFEIGERLELNKELVMFNPKQALETHAKQTFNSYV